MSNRSNTRTSRFVQNTVFTGAYQITAMLMGFVTPRLMMLFYGSQVNGLIVSVTEFLTYFRLVEAGLAAAAVYSLYKPLSEADHAGVSAIVSAARQFYNVAGWMFVGLTLLFAAIYPLFVPVATIQGDWMNYWSMFLLICAMGISGALEFFTLSRYRVLLTADQRSFMISLASMTSLLLQTAVIVVLAYLKTNIILVRLLASLTIVVRPLILSNYVKKTYPQVDAFAPPNKGALSRRWDAMYQQFTTAFHQGAAVMLTTVITRNAAMISVYGTYHMVTIGLWGILKMSTTGIYSGFGDLIVRGQKAKFQQAYKDFEYLYLALATVLFSVAAILIVPFVVLYTDKITDANYDAPLIGIMIVLEALTDHCKMPMDLMITASGKFRETRHHCTAQIATAVVAGLLLGLWGLQTSLTMAVVGILSGIILSNILRAVLQLWFVPRQITGLPWRATLKRMLLMFVEVAVIAGPFLAFGLLNINGFFKWITLSVPLCIYALAITLGFGWLFDRDSVLSLFGRIKFMFQRGK
ncbi:MAG: hypothetical protein VB087_05005 [Candidatus Limiplasma sp.]|nr:hypothetical protein [Candidatus Limiplasma sp.]MEA5145045.1 hypothetical protein [Candidatus Limiplasma sp.]